mmetsp:Transcript_15553/g.26904  ORF Transcript_15553/g.26904 Transcript_15553/m.26904 type:complete len:134 (-) Transcript_15553:319-720(-)
MEHDLQHTFESLSIILEDTNVFNRVVDRVFEELDVDNNQSLDVAEFQGYIETTCKRLGVREVPNHDQVVHVFKHLDLDNDLAVCKDELAVFLHHLFSEQRRACADKLAVRVAVQPPGAGSRKDSPEKKSRPQG